MTKATSAAARPGAARVRNAAPRGPAAARSDPLRPLRAFAQVARLGSVSRAAEALGLSQPAVTQQLQALAREHGVALLERSGRRLVPTAAGEVLLHLARPLVDGVDGLGEALRAHLDALEPAALSVAAGSVALQRLLPAALEAHARVATGGGTLRVLHAGGDAALGLLREGSVALAVGSWLDVPGDIEFTVLLRSPACLVAPAGHPLGDASADPSRALAGEPLLLPRRRQTTRQLVEPAYGRLGLPPPPVREAGDWAAVFGLVALGQGVTVSPLLAVPEVDENRWTVRMLPDAFRARPYGVAVRRGRTPGPLADAFIEALRATVPAPGP